MLCSMVFLKPCPKYLHRLQWCQSNEARCLTLAQKPRQMLHLPNPPSCNHSSGELDTRLSTQNQSWKIFVLSAFCFPELRLWLYHHVSSQIVVRGLDIGSAREAAVLESQTTHLSPPSGGANMLLLCCQTKMQGWDAVKDIYYAVFDVMAHLSAQLFNIIQKRLPSIWISSNLN